jgi:uncharacterized integral membrane protein
MEQFTLELTILILAMILTGVLLVVRAGVSRTSHTFAYLRQPNKKSNLKKGDKQNG